jgi:uncharacterized Zn finger protein
MKSQKVPGSIISLLNLSNLQKLATPSNLRLGQEINKTGQIEFLESGHSSVKAKVQPENGLRRTVILSSEPEGLNWKCSCTSKGTFCKHCVAAALRLTEEKEK